LVARPTPTAVQLWDPVHGLAEQLDQSAQRLHFTADGRFLAGLAEEDALRVWDLAGRSVLGDVPALPAVDDAGAAAAGKDRTPFFADSAWGPGDRLWVATASAHPTGWALGLDDWREAACEWAGRSLTAAEWRQFVGTDPPDDLACR